MTPASIARAPLGKYGAWHDAEACAAYLGKSKRAVQRLWDKGHLDYTKLSGERHSSTADLEAFVESERAQTRGGRPMNRLGQTGTTFTPRIVPSRRGRPRRVATTTTPSPQETRDATDIAEQSQHGNGQSV